LYGGEAGWLAAAYVPFSFKETVSTGTKPIFSIKTLIIAFAWESGQAIKLQDDPI
jgi:hypothetical protein